MTPTARSLAVLRELNYPAQVVERWLPHTRVRVDLFGCIDIVAIMDNNILGIQTTTGPNAAARCAKVEAIPEIVSWLRAGGVFQVWSWRLAGAKGKRKLWTLTRKQAYYADGLQWQTLSARESQQTTD